MLLRNTLPKPIFALFSLSKRCAAPEVVFPVVSYVYGHELVFNLTPFYPVKNQKEIIENPHAIYRFRI